MRWDEEEDEVEEDAEGKAEEVSRMITKLSATFIVKKNRDGRTDGPMDGRTVKASYRDAWTHLKMLILLIFIHFC